MSRTYLYVPFEEKDQVEALGAHRDSDSKRWYLEAGQDTEKFISWLPRYPARNGQDVTYYISSDEASVASATTGCWKCHSSIEVICIYCDSGLLSGARFEQFSVSNITAVDDALKDQLQTWPHFRMGYSEELGRDCFANYCPHCSARQERFALHCEPGGAFSRIRDGGSNSLHFTPLTGMIQMDGTEQIEL